MTHKLSFIFSSQRLQYILIVNFVFFCISSLQAQNTIVPNWKINPDKDLNPNTIWLREAKWGLFAHYMAHRPSAPIPEDMTPAKWNEKVNSFQVRAFADQLTELKAPYFFITNEAMNGRIEFKKALEDRVAILKGNSTDILENLKKNININHGARELVQTMNMNGSITVLVSGGFTFLTEYLKELLGFKHTHANTLQIIQKEFQKFEITGKVEGPILDKKAKLEYLNKYVKKYNLNYKDTICVGDGANDIEMIKHAGLGVSYYGKSALKKEADIHFNNTNLLGLLYAQGYTDNDIIK